MYITAFRLGSRSLYSFSQLLRPTEVFRLPVDPKGSGWGLAVSRHHESVDANKAVFDYRRHVFVGFEKIVEFVD